MLDYKILHYNKEKTKKHFEIWRLDDEYHRQNGPALIAYYKNGNIYYKAYFEYGKRHNLKGPAWVFYNKDGTTKSESYFINNIRYSKTKWRKLRKEF